MDSKTLFERLGGYEGITCFVHDLLPRLKADPTLRRFWDHRGTDRLDREQQLLIDYLCHNSGGPVFYSGRDMKLSHVGMKINEEDWELFLGHAGATFAALEVGEVEINDVVDFVTSLHDDIVEA